MVMPSMTRRIAELEKEIRELSNADKERLLDALISGRIETLIELAGRSRLRRD
jgi:hypothetical protein